MGARLDSLTEELLASDEPSLRWKVQVNVLGEDPNSPEMRKLADEVKRSSRVRTLLQHVDKSGVLRSDNVYAKWQGAHWVLLTLADIGYLRNDPALRPMADEVLKTWLADRFFREFESRGKADAYGKDAIPVMRGRHRTCASQQGNALYSILRLGLEDERIHQLAERLRYWQWPDGGWNCDKDPEAHTSTFIHTLWSMRGLWLYAEQTGHAESQESALRAAEFFLKRRLFKRASNGQIVAREFVKLHYPLYWHYDILGGLKAFAEMGLTHDPRLAEAVELLESKELPEGGWPAESRYYKKVSGRIELGSDYVDWGGVSSKRVNPWVTVDALHVLRHFDRLS